MVDKLVGSLEAHDQRKKKKEETFDQALQTKTSIKDERYYILKIFKVETVAVEVVEMVAVVKAVVMKDTIRRKDSRAKQIGVEKDVIEEEATNQIVVKIRLTNL